MKKICFEMCLPYLYTIQNVQYIRSFHLIKTDLTLANGRSIVNSPQLPSFVLIKKDKITNTAYTASFKKNPNKVDSLRHSR